MATIQEFYGSFHQTVEKNLAFEAMLWQDNRADKLALLLISLAGNSGMIDALWDWYVPNVFNLETCNEYGIVFWSIILDYPISPWQDAQVDGVWGFSVDDEQFDQAPFGNIEPGPVFLPLEWARLALQLRAFNLHSQFSVAEINRFFAYLLRNDPEKKIVVLDNQDMSMTYVLNFEPHYMMRFIFDELDLLPRPAAVGVSWTTNFETVWGYSNDDEQFDQAGFKPVY